MPLIVFESEEFLIADKPHAVPTVPLKGQKPDGTLLGMVSERYPEVADVCGKNPWEGGTCHRLDTATAGIVVFARTQEMYDHLQSVQAKGLFKKTYKAHCFCDDRLRGFDAPFNKKGIAEISSYFRSYGPGAKQVRPTLDIKRADSDVLYTTTVRKLSEGVFECTIARGFRHQIRAHLAWIGYPIEGDPIYGTGRDEDTLQLDCFKVEFPMPDGQLFSFAKN